MILLDETEVRVEWTDIAKRQDKRPCHDAGIRAPGVHLTDIIRYNWYGSLEQNSSLRIIREKEADEDLDNLVMPLRMVLGLAFESWIVGLYPELRWQPEPLKLDSIAGTMDGYSPGHSADPRCSSIVVEEFKLTWKSIRDRRILKETLWMWQLAGYCKMAGSRFGRLHVCWVNGDYQHGADWGPKYMRYLIEFKQHELDRLWKGLFLKNRDKVGGEKNVDENVR